MLPGVFALPGRDQDVPTRLSAIGQYGDDFVVTNEWAAADWWPELARPDNITVATPREVKGAAGFEFEQRYIRPELTRRRNGVLVTSPELTILDLIPVLGAIAVDEGLRRRVVTLGGLRQTLRLTPKRRGNRLRREVLDDSRDIPWSPLERDAHRRLRDARIFGWTTNHAVTIDGRRYYLDVAFPDLKIAIEFDGETFHGGPDAFHGDRARDQDLTSEGWIVLRFTTKSMHKLIETVLKCIRQRRAEFRRKAA